MSIIIYQNIIEELTSLVSRYREVEIGGILLGERNNTDFIITNLIYDFNEAALNKGHFVRNIEPLVKSMCDIIYTSSGRIDYIGEWHTHPCGMSFYSPMDCKAMNKLLLDFEDLLLLIQGRERLEAYLFTRNYKRKLDIIIKEGEYYG